MIDPLKGLHQAALGAYTRARIAGASSGSRAYIRELNQTQWLPRKEIEQLQIARLKKLLLHAQEHCVFYRERFKAAGFSAECFSQFSDLQALPPLTKREVQDHYREMIADNFPPDQIYENHTGGSTGTPLTFYQSREYEAWGLADIWRNFTMCGFQPGMRRAFLWGSDYDGRLHKSWRSRVIDDRLKGNVYWVNTFDVTEADLVTAAEKLVRFKPHFLIGYVSSLTLFAQVVRSHKIEGICPLGIQSSAEILTPPQRALIEETFQSKVFNRYGCREVGNIAHECDHHEGLHLLAECNYTEFLRDGQPVPPGEAGMITVTNLHNYALPLIRYQMGDMGRPTDRQPTCGRGLPLMDVVEGRSADVITTPSGKLLHGEFFTHLFYKVDGVRQFQVIQDTREHLTIKIEPMSAFRQEEAQRFLEETIHQHGDPAFTITFELVDKIPVASSGKFRFTISLVPVEV
jgi:phenylacetate-coenzyme A ligase PaaK-like adenylate-forming protein